MALNTQLSDAAANQACNIITARVNSGSIKIYTGGQPVNANTAPTGTLLVSIPLNNPAFANAVGGVANINASGVSANATNTGTAGYAAFCNSGGGVEWMVAVGLSSSNLNFGTLSMVSGGTVSVTAYTFTLNEAGS